MDNPYEAPRAPQDPEPQRVARHSGVTRWRSHVITTAVLSVVALYIAIWGIIIFY